MNKLSDYDLPYGIYHSIPRRGDAAEPSVRLDGHGSSVLIRIADAKILEGQPETAAASAEELVCWVRKHTAALLAEWEQADT